MINRRFSRLNNKNKKVVYTLIIGLLFITIGIINVAYSKYGSNYELTINTPSGEMIIDATIDDNDEYVENGLRYFLINVSNSKDDKVTATDINYKLTITNQEENENGKFYYIDTNEQTEEQKLKFDQELIIDNNSFTTEPEQMTFKIYVKVDSGLTEEVKYQVTLDAEQKEMK